MLETLSNYFYDPLIFWGAPLILAALRELAGGLHKIRRPGTRTGTRSRR